MLEDILKNKEKEVQKLKKEIDWSGAIHSCTETTKKRGFMQSLKNKVLDGKTAIIAEIKRHSPSKGYLDKNLNLKSVAEQYERAGAACISVLTDQEYFKGSLNDLVDVKKFTTLPVLRKDFIIDEVQIVDSEMHGADCVLLIIAALNKTKFRDLHQLSTSLGLDVLVEVHDIKELDIALENDCQLIGINNRNLKTFNVSLQTSIELCSALNNKDIFLVSESGIMNKTDIETLKEYGIQAFLIGEKLITSQNKEKDLIELIK